jgi:Fibronectin type III domain
MEIAVWLVAGFFGLNAFVLGTSVFMATNGRHREIRQLEALWRMGTSTVERRRAGKLVALSAVVALVIVASALALPTTGGLGTSALGPSIPMILGGGTGDPGPGEVRAIRTATASTSLADRSEGSPSDPVQTAGSGTVSDPGSPGGQSTTPAYVAAEPRSSTVIRVSWARVTGATGYDLERSTDGVAGWAWVATTGDDVTAYTDAGLDPEETYFYRVSVLLEDGAAAPPSDVVSATTPVDPPGATVLHVTSNGKTTIDLAWDDVAGESSYRIERSADGENGWTAIGTNGQDVTAYTDVGLEPDTTYFYRVVGENQGGPSPPSNVVSETTKNGAGGTDGDVDGGEEPAPDTGDTTPTPEPSILEDATAPVLEEPLAPVVEALASPVDEATVSEETAG